MDINPAVNMVVFAVKRGLKTETFLDKAPTQSKDSIRQAWQKVQSQTGARPAQVQAIYSEWQATAEDAAFLRGTFPKAEFTYSFTRPTDGNWDAAFAIAAQAMQRAAAERGESPTQPSLMPEPPPQTQATLFPVLRTVAPNDMFTQIGVCRALATNLAVFLAHAGMTPCGTIGIDYLMRNKVDTSAQAIAGLFAIAWQNMRAGLQVTAQESQGFRLFTFNHPSNMAASAIGLPDFHTQASSWVGQPVLFVAFTDPNNLFVTSPQSPFVAGLREAVQRSEYWGSVALTPACYHLDASGLNLIALRN